MICEKYKQHELGELSDKKYREHLETCDLCREIEHQDALILKQAKELKKPVSAPHLWERISRNLEAARGEGISPGSGKEAAAAAREPISEGVFPGQSADVGLRRKTIFSHRYLKLAAMLLIAVLVGVYFLLLKPADSSGLLSEKALKKVEKLEAAYMDAIAELEAVVEPCMEKLNIELALNYRDRLEAINEQIKRCKKELKENPGNRHIRRYLLAALQDKQQTLSEICPRGAPHPPS